MKNYWVILKKIVAFLAMMLPTLAFAASNTSSNALSFAPPPGDVSIVFLGNIFGVVDGVLHGSGSQIMGNMLGVFNAAVLALGGIIIMYTLIVGTMNTAHKGEFLGERWSSIWVPVRSTVGLALLIPKASGYCLMQIFVMWVVVQGVGAADKIWGAALDYLNRGGVIIKAQASPESTLAGSVASPIATGAMQILASQVCMLGLQAVLQTEREADLAIKDPAGPCSEHSSTELQQFCDSAVPDFIGTVNPVTYQTAHPLANKFSEPMPDIADGPYKPLSGICGTLTWNPISSSSINKLDKKFNSLTQEDLEASALSRAIAAQQVYLNLQTVANVIVNNNPAISRASTNGIDPIIKDFAIQQFGVPYNVSGAPCTELSSDCKTWGPDKTYESSAPLFSGTEFQGALLDYDGIMMPVLSLIKSARHAKNAARARRFIADAKAQGWLLAGSYFFDLVKLNGPATANRDLKDSDSGLEGSAFTFATNINKAFAEGGGDCAGDYRFLCEILNKRQQPLDNILGAVDGSTISASAMAVPSLTAAMDPISGAKASTVYGFVTNSMLVQLPGQPGLSPPKFKMKFKFKFQSGLGYLKKERFPCGAKGLGICWGRAIGDGLYNYLIRVVVNVLLDSVNQIINMLLLAILALPLVAIANVFINGVQIIEDPSVNPIVALANMGIAYINFAAELWIQLLELSVITIAGTAYMPGLGIAIGVLVAMSLPLLISWLGVMVSIGFITAYYVPFLPYMTFTFGGLAWFMVVIEAMVAAPIVALGVSHPEGDSAFGKGEEALMILLNVFLRPAMMIIGYIAAIALSYVGTWILNAGFAHASHFLTEDHSTMQTFEEGSSTTQLLYSNWAAIYGFFFGILIYTTLYLIMVQEAFNLIYKLPDNVLRWIGKQPEQLGHETARWGDQSKQQVEAGGQATQAGQAQISQAAGKGVISAGSAAASGGSAGGVGGE